MPFDPRQQVVPDSLAALPDSLRVAQVDSTDSIGRLGREVGEAGRLLFSGEWEMVLSRFYEGLAGLLVTFIPRLISALFVFLLFYVLYRVFRGLLTQVLERSRNVDPGVKSLLLKAFRIISITFIVIMVLAQFGINVTALLAGLSIVGIAVGFAAKDSLENFISGITILVDKPFVVSDNIEIDGTYGTVEEITLRSTRLRTLNHEIMVMPNIQMINQQLINHTMLRTVRVEIPFGIAYGEYPAEAREVVLKVAQGDDRLHPDFPPDVVVKSLNDSSVDMVLRLFIRNPKEEIKIRYAYIEKVREALREADIEIPFPHLQLFVDEAKGLQGFFPQGLPQPGSEAPGQPDEPSKPGQGT